LEYLVLKWLHVLSSTVLFGTGIGSAFYLLTASLSREPRAVAVVASWVVIADWLFTATTVVLQPLTGWRMAVLAGLPLSTLWIAWSIALYVVAGACWLLVVWLQYRMRDIARTAVRNGTALPPQYFRFLRVWVLLGVPAFAALLVVFYLMVAKPS
jgi:uncharacterized membrane protein